MGRSQVGGDLTGATARQEKSAQAACLALDSRASCLPPANNQCQWVLGLLPSLARITAERSKRIQSQHPSQVEVMQPGRPGDAVHGDRPRRGRNLQDFLLPWLCCSAVPCRRWCPCSEGGPCAPEAITPAVRPQNQEKHLVGAATRNHGSKAALSG